MAAAFQQPGSARDPQQLFHDLASKLAGITSPRQLASAFKFCCKHLTCHSIALYQWTDADSLQPLACGDHRQLTLATSETACLAVPHWLSKVEQGSLAPADLSGVIPTDLNHWPLTSHLSCLRWHNTGEPAGLALLSWQTPPPVTLELQRLTPIVELLSITSQQLHELQQQQQQNKALAEILNSSDSIYSSWNQRFGWTYHNVRGLQRLGFKKDDINITENAFNNPMPESDWQASTQLFEQCIRTGEGYRHDFRAMGKADKIRWYHNKVIPTEHDDQGHTQQLVSVARDITHIKNAEQRIIDFAQEEQWLVRLSNRLFDCKTLTSLNSVVAELSSYLKVDRCTVRLLDPETRYTNLIAEWHQPDMIPLATLFPNTITQLGTGWIGRLINLGKTYIANNITEDVPSKTLVRYYQAIGAKSTITQPMITGDQLTGYLAVTSNTLRQWSKSDCHVTKVITDNIQLAVSRIRLLNDMRANEERFQVAMDSSTHGLWDYDLRNHQLNISPHYFTAMGYAPDELKISFKTILQLTHPDDRHHFRATRIQQSANELQGVNLELRQRQKNGKYIWILCRGKVVEKDKKGNALRLMGINLDITPFKERQEQLRHIREQAEAANLAKSEFLERMSHEIRTPMNAITGMSYLSLKTPLNDLQRGYIEDIDTAAKSLLNIIDDILDFSKIESGELTIRNHRFDLTAELEHAIKLMEPRAIKSNNDLKLTQADDVPRYVVGDSQRLSQVLINLLSNAVKFTNEGTVSLSVQCADINKDTNNLSLLFSVSDSGIGLTEQQTQSLFEPFTQAEDSTNRKYGGTGLGLSICKNLVELMGGSIHVISLPNVGTTFHFSIVFKQTHQKTETKNKNTEKNSSGILEKSSGVFTGKKVLVVEDNIVNQRVAQGILKKFNIDVSLADNGQHALDYLQGQQECPFDAILMDIEMPVLNGIETTRAIRAQTKFTKVPIIAMTAHAMVGDKEKCLAAGMNHYLSKPVNPQELADTLQRLWYDGDPQQGARQ